MFRKAFCISAIFIAIGVLACTSKKHETHDDQEISSGTWKEMDDFHTIMAESFHPFKDSANLEPAIKNASAMAEAAAHWAEASLPGKVDNDETKAMLQEMKSATLAFVERVKSGNDEEIGNSLTELHDLFHKLQEEWYAAAGDHEEHH